MRERIQGILVALALAGLLAAPASGQESEENPAERTIVVEMVDFEFRPAKVTVRPGDTVRFVQKVKTPHNVEFRDVPGDASLGDRYVFPVEERGSRPAPSLPERMGPFLTRVGQTYDVVITRAFPAGEYGFVCTPHEAMGMTGTLVVQRPGEVVTRDTDSETTAGPDRSAPGSRNQPGAKGEGR